MLKLLQNLFYDSFMIDFCHHTLHILLQFSAMWFYPSIILFSSAKRFSILQIHFQNVTIRYYFVVSPVDCLNRLFTIENKKSLSIRSLLFLIDGAGKGKGRARKSEEITIYLYRTKSDVIVDSNV